MTSRRHSLRIATYNIHRCRGLDGRTRPERIADVLQGDRRRRHRAAGSDRRRAARRRATREELGAALGMGWVMSSARVCAATSSATLSSAGFRSSSTSQHDLSWKTCEPRGCQRVDVSIDGSTLHVYNVHLGTALLERRVPGRAARRDRHRSARRPARKSCSGTSTNGCGGW